MSRIDFETYLEPFVGGAAVFLSFCPKSSVLADSNAELITSYRALRDNPRAVHALLSQIECGRAEYYQQRRSTQASPEGIAARFLYLRSTAFGGLYRLNRGGEFNVPYGGLRRLHLPSLQEILDLSSALHETRLCEADYTVTLEHAGPRDLVFADPPYASFQDGHSVFNRYLDRQFTSDHHRQLAKELTELVYSGTVVIATNTADQAVRALYDQHAFFRFKVARRSSMARSTVHRGTVYESVFVSRNIPMSRSTVGRYLADVHP